MHAHRMLALSVLLVVAILILCGCGSETRTDGDTKREMVSESHTTTKEVTVHTPTADGGFIVEKTTTTDTTAGERTATTNRETARTAPDDATRSLIGSGARMIGVAASVGIGGIGLGEGLGAGLAALLTAGVTAWGAAKNSEAKAERKRAEEHKADADAGWTKYENERHRT